MSPRASSLSTQPCKEQGRTLCRVSSDHFGLDDVLAAIDLQRLHQFSFRDAVIVRGAVRGSCKHLYSEDMQHGRRIEGDEIVNPLV